MLDHRPPEVLTHRPLAAWQRHLLAIAACAATTAIATPFLGMLDLANIVMLFLLTVLLVAVSLGQGPAVLASILSVLCFDVFFVPPRFSLTVDNLQYVVTFAVMLATGLVTGQLAARLKQKAVEAEMRERRTQALYELARQLAGALTVEQAVEMTGSFVQQQLPALARVILDDAEPPHPAPDGCHADAQFVSIARNSGQIVHNMSMAGTQEACLYLPLQSAMRIRGVLAVALIDYSPEYEPECEALLGAVAILAAVAIERLHYVDVAHATQLDMVGERLRSSVLSAVSHDLRTPLTALVGLADSLSLVKPPLPAPAMETAQALRDQANRLAGQVGNLLDMARLNAGSVTLRREWQPLEEVVGAAIKSLSVALDGHTVLVALPPGLPLLSFDAVLVERVFCNLIENAAKYGGAQGKILISAEALPETVSVRVCDEGPGFPPDSERLFTMFTRGDHESPTIGSGLGLAICRAVIEAHGGTIRAENRAIGGACVVFTLPRGTPPVVEEEVP